MLTFNGGSIARADIFHFVSFIEALRARGHYIRRGQEQCVQHMVPAQQKQKQKAMKQNKAKH